MWGRKDFSFPRPPFFWRDACVRLLAARARCVAAFHEIATGLGDVPQDLCTITGLEHYQLRVFLWLVHVLLLSCL